jgi:hypothetical protein
MRAPVVLQCHLVPAGEHGITDDELSLVLFQEELHAPGQRVGGLARLVEHAGVVEARHVHGDAQFLQRRQRAVQLGLVDERLGGDAPDVQADPAHLVALDDGRLQAELSGPDAGNVAARARAHDENVVVEACHLWSSVVV